MAEKTTRSSSGLLKILTWLSIGLMSLLVIVAIGLWILLGTEAGRLWMANTAISAVNRSDSMQVQIERLQSPDLGELTFEALQITKNGQPWIDAKGFNLSWSPADLIWKKLTIARLQLAQLYLYGTASSQQPETDPSQGEWNLNSLDFPEIQIKTFGIDRIGLGSSPLAGAQQTPIPDFRIEGEFEWLKSAPFNLNVQARLDGNSSTLIAINATQDQSQLELSARITEPAGGFIGHLFRIPPEQSVDADFFARVFRQNGNINLTIERLAAPVAERELSAQGVLNISPDIKEFTLSDALVAIDETEHRIDGRISNESLALSLDLDTFPLGLLTEFNLLQYDNSELTGGTLSAQIDLSGTPTNPDFVAQATLNTLLNDQPLLASFSGDGNMQLIDIEKLDVSWDAASLALNGILDTGTETSDLTLQLANFNINRLSEFGVPIPDDAEIIIESATGQLSGNIRDPDARLNAELTGDYADLPLQAVIDASGNTSAVEIESLVVSLADAALGAKGMIDLQTDNSQFVFQLTNFDLTQLEQFGVALPSGILARVESANGELSGNLRDPDAQLNAQLAGNYADLPFELSASAIKTQSMLVTDKVDMRFGDNQLLASGAIDLDTMIGEFNVETEPFSIKIFELTGISLPTELAGMIEGNANISGDLRNPQVFANLNLDGRYKDISYRAKADLSRVDQLINIRSINISALERDVLDIQGSVDHENLDIQLVANRLPAELLSAVGLNIAPGAFTADFNVVGPIRLPDMNGFLSYKTTPAESGPNGVLAENQFEWRLEAETLGQDSDNKPEATGRESYRFRSIFSTSGTPSGELSFQIPARPYMDFIHRAGGTDISTLPLNVRLDGGFDLSMVALFADPDIHRLSGRLVADLDIRGTLASPSFLGEVAFQDTDYENPLSGTHIEQLNCVLNADGGRFEFGKCVASDGDSGNFTIRGSLALPLRESSGDIDIEMEVNRARVIQRPEIESQATGSIQLTGDFQSLLAKGSIEVAPLEASIESGTSSGIPKIQVEKVESLATYNGSEGTSNAASPLITLDLLITATQQAYIRGRGLEAELQGEIYLKGTAQKPRYEGEFSTIRGDFEVFGKTFELENGLVNFANDAIGLNFEGVYEEDGQSVTALITGTAEDLNISFTATPAMAEDEILAFIIFGKSIQEITPFEAIQLASAVQQLRGGGGFDPIGAARDALGVDRLSIESETLEDNSTGVNVGVGKYLNERVYLELERTPNPSQPWKGNIEIELTPNLNLESSTGGSTGIEGAELKWKKDY